MRIAFGTDERTAVTDHVRRLLAELGHEVDLVGEGDPWPDVGRRVGERVASGRCERGVVCCWTGTGVSMAANQVPGVRAALCTDAETARGARRWNDANVLALGLRLTSETVATEMLHAFLTTDADPAEASTIARLADPASPFALAARRVAAGASAHEEAAVLVAAMTVQERLGCLDGDTPFWPGLADMTSGGYYQHPWPAGRVERLGIPGIDFADGPRGCVIGAATAFPVSMARGATFDPALEEDVGRAIGAELRASGATFTGAVCLNLLRHPAWGRAQETYGEDPLHVGEMAAALTRGLQQHVMACMKHFALNSMENARFWVDVTADERALHEVYLPHFRRVAAEGVAATMSAYNSVNGAWCGQNVELLAGVLRGEWDWDGLIVSDFVFGVRDPVASLRAGLDIEMPFAMTRAMALPDALASGRLERGVVDAAVTRIVATLLRFGDVFERRPESAVIASDEHRDLARRVAVRSMVLLRNEPPTGSDDRRPLLPVNRSDLRRVAVLGRLAAVPNLGDGGSSDVHPPAVSTVLDGLREALPHVTVDHADDEASIAAGADLAVVVVGYTKADEGEYIDAAGTMELAATLFPPVDHPTLGRSAGPVPAGAPAGTEGDTDDDAGPVDPAAPPAMAPGGDRRSLRLHPSDEALVEAVAAANERTLVLVMSGSAVVMPWATSVPAVLQIWYPGMEGGRAVASVLLGEEEPGGRLPFAVPTDERDLVPFDPDARAVTYGLFHGQWLLDRTGVPAAFPFGHGLGYTTFSLQHADLGPDGRTLRATVRNEGDRAGSTVVFAWGGLAASAWERPARRLIGFQRVAADAGAGVDIELSLEWSVLAVRTPQGFVDEPGSYEVEVGFRAHDPAAITIVVDRP